VAKYLLFLAVSSLCAQSLRISPSAASVRRPGSFLITLTSPAGKNPVALQWKMVLPEEVRIDLKEIVPGSAAESVQKSITCAAAKDHPAAKEQSGSGQAYSCILAGGEKTISDGPVAVVKYKINEKPHVRTLNIQLLDAFGVSIDLKKLAIADTPGLITIQ
jgi:hypothetical protein